MDSQIPYVIPLSGSVKPRVITLVPSDPGSRYKTKQMQVQTVGKSKMIKTVFVNILECAKAMQVPPAYVVVFMGYEIGAQAKFDSKKPERQQAILSGEHDTKDLSKICSQFISEVVLCPVCGLPEILLQIQNDTVMGSCRACGNVSTMPISNEKFKRYIINHPPSKGDKGAFAGNQTSKKTKDKKKKKHSSSDEEEEPVIEEAVPESNGKQNGPKQERVVWYSDTSEDAVRKRREEMLPDSGMFQNVKVEKITPAALAKLLSECSLDERVDKLEKKKAEEGVSDEDFIPILFNALFPKDSAVTPEVKNHRALLSKFVKSEGTQRALLDTIEHFCGHVNPTLKAKASFVVKEFYDQELLDEEAILKWFGKTESYSNEEVRKNIAPFVKWLKEAEEEEDEDDDDEE